MSKVVQMKGNKEVYNAIMGNLKPVGNKMYAMIPASLIYFDPLYQRIETRSKDKITKLAMNWDSLKMDALKVVPHPESFCFSCVDGYGRIRAGMRNGVEAFECEVILNAPMDIEERRSFEANIFLDQSKYVEALKPLQMHNARLVVHDKNAIIMQKLADDYNMKITVTGPGRRTPGVLGSYAVAYDIVKLQGEAGLHFVLEACKEAGYNFELNGYNSYVFRSLAKIYQAYHCDPRFIGEFMRNTKPSTLKAKAVAKYPERSNAIALTLFLQDYYVSKTGISPRINKLGKIIA